MLPDLPIQFTGNLEEGAKTNAVLYKVAKNAIDKKCCLFNRRL